MIKFFRDAYFKAEDVLVRSPELKDVKNEMAGTTRYSFWEIKKTALPAILICGHKIASLKEEFVKKS